MQSFLQKVKNAEDVSFNDTLTIIKAHYLYQPTEFSNGSGDDRVLNLAGENEGSCKIFAFAALNQLSPAQTLSLFGDYYRVDVLGFPDANDHKNIRNFMKYGWDGIVFKGQALISA